MKRAPFSPPLLVLTDGAATGGRPLVEVVAAALEGGARAVLLREKHLPRSERAELAAEIGRLLAAIGGVLLVASDGSLPADGLHLAAGEPLPSPPPPLTGRSCHSRAEVEMAAREGCDYATLSPIFPTPSKPGYGPPLGPDVLDGLPLPVLALGGVDEKNAPACMKAGAAGVAVMGAVMRAPDPSTVVAHLVDELEVALR